MPTSAAPFSILRRETDPQAAAQQPSERRD